MHLLTRSSFDQVCATFEIGLSSADISYLGQKRHFAGGAECPLYSQKWTSVERVAMSALCQKQTLEDVKAIEGHQRNLGSWACARGMEEIGVGLSRTRPFQKFDAG